MPDPKTRQRKAILDEIGKLVRACRTKPLRLEDLATLRDLIAARGKLDRPRQGELALAADRGLDRAAWRKGAADGNPFA